MLVNISNDSEYLNEKLVESDSFTKQLLSIYNSVRDNSSPEDVATNLGIFRTDYIIDDEDIKQVEMNTISVSFAGLMSRVQQFHRSMIKFCNSSIPITSLPALNDDQASVPASLAAAHRFYTAKSQPKSILFVVENGATNIFDMESIRLSDHLLDIPCHRCVFSELQSRLTIGQHKEMLFKPDDRPLTEISVVYFRTGYVPADYDFKDAYELRSIIECSRAIKCPSVGYQLAGMKYIQCTLSVPETLKRFLAPEDLELFQEIRNTFTKFCAVGQRSLKLVENDAPGKYVLKNNLEGGGHNVFGDEVLPAMKDVIANGQENQYILMQFLSQTPQTASVLRDDDSLSIERVDSELGIYGTVLASSSNKDVCFHFSHGWGHLLRVKNCELLEAGVMHGDGALSSVYTV